MFFELIFKLIHQKSKGRRRKCRANEANNTAGERHESCCVRVGHKYREIGGSQQKEL